MWNILMVSEYENGWLLLSHKQHIFNLGFFKKKPTLSQILPKMSRALCACLFSFCGDIFGQRLSF